MRDLRKYAKQTNIRLIMGGILLIFVLGDSLVYFIYGLPAAVSGLLCFGIGLLPVLLIVGSLWILERIKDWMD